jgi:proteasome lid subunit RPN8/RPN11
MPQEFMEFINKRAKSERKEIYGWLIGYRKEGICNIIALSECSKFKEQTQINAIPDSKEFYEISSILPQGIGPIGIYHSHPFSKKIFMSSFDIDTLSNLTKKFPKTISIISNGKNTKSFQMNDKREVKEIQRKDRYLGPPDFILLELDEKSIIKVDQKFFNDSENKIEQLKALISNKIVNFFYKNWSKVSMIYNSKKISPSDTIKNFICKDMKDPSLKMKIPHSLKEDEKIVLSISQKNKKDSNRLSEGYIHLEFDITARIPIYVVNNNLLVKDIINSIKTELISNNLLRKIFNSIVDLDAGTIEIPKDININFFGFYINLQGFKDRKLNDLIESDVLLNFFQKNYVLFQELLNKRSNIQIKEDIRCFLEDFDTFVKYFPWNQEVKNKIEELKEVIILN